MAPNEAERPTDRNAARAPKRDFHRALADLTEAQRSAVEHIDGPLLVLAGPGSGKTRVIARRIAHLISCGIPAWQILALTFTNKAAAEMRERVDNFFGTGHDGGSGGSVASRATRGLTITTFHSLCARLVRKHADIAKASLGGLTPTFTIYDTADQTALVKRAIEELNFSSTNWPARSVLSRISNLKNELTDAEAFEKRAGDFSDRMVARIFTAYQRLLRAANAVDFDDLLLLTERMLRENPVVRTSCRERWRYLLIDEYQDTNLAQFQIASLLCGGTLKDEVSAVPNICVVGDPDQSIYGWRGADISNILDFEQTYPGARAIPLGENFRSTAKIIACADALIRNNVRRKHKPLHTANPPGESVEVTLCRDEHHEARLAVEWLRKLREESGEVSAWKDCAVFYRANALSRVVEDEFRSSGVPYTVARGTAFYQREEVRHALAYLRVVANPADDVSLERIVNTPARGIGDATLEKLRAWDPRSPLFDLLRNGPGALGLPARTANAVRNFVQTLDGWRGEFGNAQEQPLLAGSLAGESLADLVERVVRESGLEAMYKAGRTESDEDRLENLAELITSAREFEDGFVAEEDPAAELVVESEPTAEAMQADDPFGFAEQAEAFAEEQSGGEDQAEPNGAAAVRAASKPSVLELLRAYLERVTLVSDADTVDPDQGAVTLMTLHAAKGLEFDAVAMIGLEEGTLPHSRGLESEADLEEERRLCFVGITRARKRLHLTSARYRTFRGVPERTVPSRFIEELPGEHVRMLDRSDFAEAGWDEGAGASDRASEPVWGRSSYDAMRDAASSRASSDVNAKHMSGAGGLRAGTTVRHPQFGLGKVLSVTRGSGARAQIQFRDAGTKTLVLEYARLEIIQR
ncbi:MAG: UvrD-helicase domain-containing protein [Phycisphaeraceae bacterium]|nr:UvrD-helicase domain-containing protein [Phycisphaeraceae bacterium]